MQVSNAVLRLPAVEPEQYWTIPQIASRVHKSTACVKKWLESKQLKKTKIGGSTLITESDFQDFVRRSNEKSTPKAA